jgi:hydrogenase maturation protein HypF
LYALRLVRKNTRTFTTTSMGLLFDTAAAMLGFTREITFEGQAAMWLERLARNAPQADTYPFPFVGGELDFRPLLEGIVHDRLSGRDEREIARAFQRGIAAGLDDALTVQRDTQSVDTVVLSGGVFQNELLLGDLKTLLERGRLQAWTNHVVPANDGGISLGQAALAASAVPESRGVASGEAESRRMPPGDRNKSAYGRSHFSKRIGIRY